MMWANEMEFEILLATLDKQRTNPVVKDGHCVYTSSSGKWTVRSDELGHRIIVSEMSIVFNYDAISFNKSYIRLYQLKNPDNCLYISRSKKCPF